MSTASLATTPFDRCSPSRRAMEVSTGGTSTDGDTSRTIGTMASPATTYPTSTARNASRSAQPAASSAPTASPETSAPVAVAIDPTRLYQA